MKRSYSSISLIFAIVIHVLIMAIMYILFLLEPKQDEKAATGQKFRISLKEYKKMMAIPVIAFLISVY